MQKTTTNLDTILRRAPDGTVLGSYVCRLSEPLTEHFPWGKMVDGVAVVPGRWAPRVAAIFGSRVVSWEPADERAPATTMLGTPPAASANTHSVLATEAEKAASKSRRRKALISAPVDADAPKFADASGAEEAPDDAAAKEDALG